VLGQRASTHACTHTHTHTHTWTYTRGHTHVDIHAYMCECLYVCRDAVVLSCRTLHLSLIVRTHITRGANARAPVCVCVCVCVCASMSGCVPVLVWQAWKWQGLRSGETLCKCPPTTLAENARARRHPFCPTLNPKPQSPQASLLSCARMRVWTSWCAWTCSCVRTGIGPCPMCVCLCVCVCVNVL